MDSIPAPTLAVTVREARDTDAEAVCHVFETVYGEHYAYPQFYDVDFMKRLIMGEDTLTLVAQHDESSAILGTASVVLEVGAMADLVGEFGRLAVLPEARGHGIGHLLMRERLDRVCRRLHMGIVEARVTHHHSLTIAQRHGFVPVGFCPLKNLFDVRESIALCARWFNDGLALRRNHPRIIPEADALADLVMRNAGLQPHAIIDEDSPPYPHKRDFTIDQLTTTGYASLLRIERGRVRNREVFGPMRLQYGFFKLHTEHASYLLARRKGRVAGALGYIHDEHEDLIRIFELITPDDQAIQFLLSEIERRAREEWGVGYIEIDVSAYAPRMQRTLLELGFMPIAYFPSMVFFEVERLDIVRMARVLVPLKLAGLHLTPEMREVADIVIESLTPLEMMPRIGAAVSQSPLLRGLTDEQVSRLSSIFSLQTFCAEDHLLREGDTGDALLLVLDGTIDIVRDGMTEPLGQVGPGEVLGEMGLLAARQHGATAAARTPGVAARVTYAALHALLRRRPDIGVVIYRNLATGLGEKLRRAKRSSR